MTLLALLLALLPTLDEARARESQGDLDGARAIYRELAANPGAAEAPAARRHLNWIETHAAVDVALTAELLRLRALPDAAVTREAIASFAARAAGLGPGPVRSEFLRFAAEAFEHRVHNCVEAVPLYRAAREGPPLPNEDEHALVLGEASCLQKAGQSLRALLLLRHERLADRTEYRRLLIETLGRGFAPLAGAVLWMVPVLVLLLLGWARSGGAVLELRTLAPGRGALAAGLWLLMPWVLMKRYDPVLGGPFLRLALALALALMAAHLIGVALRLGHPSHALRTLARLSALLAPLAAAWRAVARTELPESLLHWPAAGRPGGEALPALLLLASVGGAMAIAVMATNVDAGDRS